jgi:hypothetical protein
VFCSDAEPSPATDALESHDAGLRLVAAFPGPWVMPWPFQRDVVSACSAISAISARCERRFLIATGSPLDEWTCPCVAGGGESESDVAGWGSELSLPPSRRCKRKAARTSGGSSVISGRRRVVRSSSKPYFTT